MRDIRNEECNLCRHHIGVDEVCQLGTGNGPIMVVTSRHNSETYQALIEGQLRDVGLDPTNCYFTAVIKCKNFDTNIGKKDLKACSPYLHLETEAIKPEWILAMGNEALQAMTGHSGITNWRGKVIEKNGYKVFPSLSPAAMVRNPGQAASYMADLRHFAARIYGKAAKVQPPTIHTIDNNEKFQKLKAILRRTDTIAFDIENTIVPNEFHPDAKIISLSGTCIVDGKIFVWAVPLYHPKSVFRKRWVKAVRQLTPLIAAVPKRIGQNAKHDCRWLRRFSECDIDLTFDTMLAVHLLDENREKGLKPQATSRLGVAPWGVDTKNLLNMPIAEVLEYNALDTYYDYFVYLQARKELQEQPRLLRIFKTITMPAANLLIGVEQRGAFIDREKLATNGKIARDMRDEIERKLMEWVPTPPHKENEYCVLCESGEHEVAGDWPMRRRGKREIPVEVNFNPSNFARWFLFDHLGLSILQRGKSKDDGREGDPSMAEDVLLELRGTHPVVELMLQRAEWNQKIKAFFNAYDELLTDTNRLHTTFKIAGTRTGRLSSGKEEKEKFAAKAPVRGINLQQTPRDPLVRSLFSAPPGYTFVEADFSQVELRIIAFLSRDRTMLSLYQAGEDIHAATASWILGVPRSKVSKDDRKRAKPVNFGFAYGMGWRKFIYTAFTKYGVRFSDHEAQAVRIAFFEQFNRLMAWHARQRRLVNENRRVQNPIGRIRHLPDIDSPDEGVRAEAERQAINSPVQSFGSDLCMLSMIEIDKGFKDKSLDAYTIGTVHDALLFEVRDEHLGIALPLIKTTMEHLPLERKFGLHLDVPIVADIKIGNWGEGRELTDEEVYNWTGLDEAL